jgi:hypothetical protein
MLNRTFASQNSQTNNLNLVMLIAQSGRQNIRVPATAFLRAFGAVRFPVWRCPQFETFSAVFFGELIDDRGGVPRAGRLFARHPSRGSFCIEKASSIGFRLGE